MNKKTTVEIQLSARKGVYKINLKTLHGARVVDKKNATSTDTNELFTLADSYIEKQDATNISMKKGILEDSLYKFLYAKNNERKEAGKNKSKVIKGVDTDTLSAEGRELASDLLVFESCVQETISQDDFESMFYQGIHYLITRRELFNLDGKIADEFDMTLELPMEKKEDVVDAFMNINEELTLLVGKPLTMNKYKRIIIFTGEGYKLTINFKED